ncbi:hypothetical protein DXG01_014597 [Tephrocybe rancida]|nr:hypothetical protein DXG01_014597 [Tephrocybe rancida]
MTAASNADGAIVTIETCTYADNQKWTFIGGTVQVFGNKCLDVPEGSTVDGTHMQIWTCTANDVNQQFSYTGDNRLAWTNKGKCVDLTSGNQASGTQTGHFFDRVIYEYRAAQLTSFACTDNNHNQIWNAGYNVNNLPPTSQSNQFGTNNCGTTSSQTSNCQTAYLKYAQLPSTPPPPLLTYLAMLTQFRRGLLFMGAPTIGDTEHDEVAWCTKSDRGTRIIPNGALAGVHFVKTSNYVQVSGVGDFTKLNIRGGDEGGELDNRGADAGGLVFGDTFGNGTQYHEWTSFISDTEFCFRACTGADATVNCNHIYDVMGCFWNIPANYDAGVFETCDGDNDLPMGVYGTSTWFQGVSPTPPAHPAASSSNCVAVPTVTVAPAKREVAVKGRGLSAFPRATTVPN